MRMPAVFGKKTSDFSKFMVCPFGQRGLVHCGHFSDKMEGVNFLRFCADVFYGRPQRVNNNLVNLAFHILRLCSFCNLYLETTIHSFCNCQLVECL